MQELSYLEWKLLDKIILDIHSLKSLSALELYILEELPKYIGAEFASWNEHDPYFHLTKVSNTIFYQDKIDPLVETLNKVMHTHPSFGHYFDFASNKIKLIDTVERTRELDTAGTYYETDFYKKVASKVGVEDQLLMHVYVKDGYGTLLTFHSKRQFTPTEHLLASILRGHILARLYVLNQALEVHQVTSEEKRKELKVLLTLREFETLELLCKGHSNQEMASHLSISDRTIEKHVGKILQKLQLLSRSQVISAYSSWL